MAEMLTDLLQNIYSRISQLGKSIKSLQNSVDDLNSTLTDKVATLVNSIQEMTENVKKEGEMQAYYFENIGDQAVNEVKLLQEKIGLKDLDEVLDKLNNITAASEEALKPETVDLLLHEVLEGIKDLKQGDTAEEADISDEELMFKVKQSLDHQEEISSQVQSLDVNAEDLSSTSEKKGKPPKPPKFTPPSSQKGDQESTPDKAEKKEKRKRPNFQPPP